MVQFLTLLLPMTSTTPAYFLAVAGALLRNTVMGKDCASILNSGSAIWYKEKVMQQKNTVHQFM